MKNSPEQDKIRKRQREKKGQVNCLAITEKLKTNKIL